MSCLEWCELNNGRITMKDLLRRGETTIETLDAKREGTNYRLEYAPVGNSISDPVVIICGITPGNDTWKMYLDAIRDGDSPEKAAMESIYSNMREKLFKCLNGIGLFDYLAKSNDYWCQTTETRDNKKTLWDMLFSDEIASKNSGIQLTQACNCAILRNNSSQMPTNAALNEIRAKEPKCLFNRFTITPSLKLIIFLGTTLDLNEYWEESYYYNSGIKTLAVPHPSGANRVYNNDALFKDFSETDNMQLRNAKMRIKHAKKVISNLQ